MLGPWADDLAHVTPGARYITDDEFGETLAVLCEFSDAPPKATGLTSRIALRRFRSTPCAPRVFSK